MTPQNPTPPRRGRSVSFARVVVVWLAFTGVCWVVVGALLAPLLPGGWRGVLGAAVLGVLPLAVLVRGFGGRAYPSAGVRRWVVRPFWYLQLALPLLATAGLLGLLVGLPLGAGGRGGWLGLAVTGCVLAVGIVAGYAGSRRLVVRRLEAVLPDLPPGLDGVRIVQLSDLHVGPHTPRRHLARVVEAVRAASPELIAFTGDQVDDYGRDVRDFADAFRSLSAPLGVFAIAGNHDVYAGWAEVRAGLEEMGARVLVNAAVPVSRGGAALWVAGTGDPAGEYWGGGGAAAPELEQTLAAVPAGGFVLALAHNPVLWPGLARRGVPLTLSGHTHYGQLAIPRLGWSLASPFLEHAMGVYREGDSLLYIHPGTNYWGIPFRLGAPPEVTSITLRRGSPAAIERGD